MSSNPARKFLLIFFSYQYFAQFSRLSRNEKGEHYFIVHSVVLYSFIQSYIMRIGLLYKIWPKSLLNVVFLLKAMIKQFLILQNVIKVMVVLLRGDG